MFIIRPIVQDTGSFETLSGGVVAEHFYGHLYHSKFKTFISLKLLVSNNKKKNY